MSKKKNVSEINSKYWVFTHYFSALSWLESRPNFRHSPLSTNNQKSDETLHSGQALADLCDLRYANDTISLHGRNSMQMLLAASAATHSLAGPGRAQSQHCESVVLCLFWSFVNDITTGEETCYKWHLRGCLIENTVQLEPYCYF